MRCKTSDFREATLGVIRIGRYPAIERICGFWLAFCMLMPLAGCGYLPWPESFGEVAGANSTRSVNGLGVYRRMWESTGAHVLTPKKLSPRLANIDTIILVGSTYQPPGSLARDWLEKWLGEKSGRTLVYFGRDFDAGMMYREETLDQVAKSDRERARNQLASSRASRYVLRNAEIPEDTFCRWFFLRTSARPSVETSFSGPWSKQLAGIGGKWPVGVLLEPPDQKFKSKQPSWIKGTKPAMAPVNSFFNGADAEEELGDKEIQRSIWRTEELEDAEAWDYEWELAGKAATLLAGESGKPLVYRIDHPDFPGSKIVIVVNGAPFLNGSLVKPLHRKISEMVINECSPTKRVAMIEFDQSGLLISNISGGGDSNVGMELLTLWPLSAITMHAAFLGIIAFAVLLPILGRPQKLAPRSVTDFGLHVEAMGSMLFETRDMQYGLKSIGDYFRKVRRESPPEWLTQMAAMEAAAQAEKQAAKPAKANRDAKSTQKTPPPLPSQSVVETKVEQPVGLGTLPVTDSRISLEPVSDRELNELPTVDNPKPTNTSPSDPVS